MLIYAGPDHSDQAELQVEVRHSVEPKIQKAPGVPPIWKSPP